MEIMIIFGIILCIIAGVVGSNRKIGFFIPFFISFFLTPIVGIIVALCSRSLDDIAKDNRMMEIQEEKLKLAKEKVNVNDIITQLEKLAAIKDSGVLTDEEFQKMKDEIMSGKSDCEKSKPKEFSGEIIIDGRTIRYSSEEEDIDGRTRCTIQFEDGKGGKIYSVPRTEEYAFIATGKFIDYKNKDSALIALYRYLDTSMVSYKGRSNTM